MGLKQEAKLEQIVPSHSTMHHWRHKEGRERKHSWWDISEPKNCILLVLSTIWAEIDEENLVLWACFEPVWEFVQERYGLITEHKAHTFQGSPSRWWVAQSCFKTRVRGRAGGEGTCCMGGARGTQGIFQAQHALNEIRSRRKWGLAWSLLCKLTLMCTALNALPPMQGPQHALAKHAVAPCFYLGAQVKKLSHDISLNKGLSHRCNFHFINTFNI